MEMIERNNCALTVSYKIVWSEGRWGWSTRVDQVQGLHLQICLVARDVYLRARLSVSSGKGASVHPPLSPSIAGQLPLLLFLSSCCQHAFWAILDPSVCGALTCHENWSTKPY